MLPIDRSDPINVIVISGTKYWISLARITNEVEVSPKSNHGTHANISAQVVLSVEYPRHWPSKNGTLPVAGAHQINSSIVGVMAEVIWNIFQNKLVCIRWVSFYSEWQSWSMVRNFCWWSSWSNIIEFINSMSPCCNRSYSVCVSCINLTSHCNILSGF